MGKAKKPRAENYDEKLAIDGVFEDVISLSVGSDKAEPLTLYVDEFKAGGRMANVTSERNRVYNLRKIHGQMASYLGEVVAEREEGTVIKEVGRYVLVFTISLAEHHFQMAFFDFAHDKSIALGLANTFDDPEMKRLLLDTYQIVSDGYEKNYDSVRLVQGLAPLEA